MRDIRLYWDEMEEGANQSGALSVSRDCIMTSEDELEACTCPRFKVSDFRGISCHNYK